MACQRGGRVRGEVVRLALTLHCDQPDRQVDRCLRLLAGADRLGLGSASMITTASVLTAVSATALERAGVGYAQVALDGTVTGADRALERDLANLRRATSSRSMVWHIRVSLADETAGNAGMLIKLLAERLPAARFDISFAAPTSRPHRCAACDSRGGTVAAVLDADGSAWDDRETRCACAKPDHVAPDHDALTASVRTAILSHLYAARGLDRSS